MSCHSAHSDTRPFTGVKQAPFLLYVPSHDIKSFPFFFTPTTPFCDSCSCFLPSFSKLKVLFCPKSDQHLAIIAQPSWFYSSVCLSCEFISVTTAVALRGHSVLLLCQSCDSSNLYQMYPMCGAVSEPLQVLCVLRRQEDMGSLQVLICVLCRCIHVGCQSTKLCLLVWMA